MYEKKKVSFYFLINSFINTGVNPSFYLLQIELLRAERVNHGNIIKVDLIYA